ncbi:MAG: hypothetical protein MZV63_71515 [Marinilabiliales bacterium]|nr:hypothetical protein [Marinilabiliales bacterium]
MQRLEEKYKMVDEVVAFLRKSSVAPSDINTFLVEKGTSEINQKIKGNQSCRPGRRSD